MASLMNTIQFHLVEENYQRDIEIISYGDVCDSIIFVIDGKITIEFHNEEGDCRDVDTLRTGDVIGA